MHTNAQVALEAATRLLADSGASPAVVKRTANEFLNWLREND